MTTDTMAADKTPPARPFASALSAGVLGTLVVLWSALAWGLAHWLAQDRIAALIANGEAELRRSLSGTHDNLEHVLNRLEGFPAVLGGGSDVTTALATFGHGVKRSALPREARVAAWSQRPDLLALGRQLKEAAREIDVDIIWVMNASGDCVAASNVAEPQSFVGTNYADRKYFVMPRAGSRGMQYAMGRMTNVPGLFFSAPVTVDGRFLGAVAIKVDLPKLAPRISHPRVFVTDEFGVIILAGNRDLELRAVPGAAVQRLTAVERAERYKRAEFATYGIEAPFSAALPKLLRVTGSAHPHLVERRELGQHGFALHLHMPLEGIAEIRSDAFGAFLLLWFSGILVIALAFGTRAYLANARHHRRAIESTNESLRQLNADLDHLARSDPLTGCANRRHFQSCIEAELARAARHGRDCSLLAIDLDHFKKVNDTHGHAAGDEVLRHFARTALRELRKEDMLGRVGGEEFAVLLPETGLRRAIDVAERIRRAVETSPAQFGAGSIALTASFGAACRMVGADTPDALMQRADAALYAAKAGGRNRVAVAHANKAETAEPSA